MRQNYIFRHLKAGLLQKLIFFIFIFSLHFSFFSFHLAAQGVTKHGESKATNNDFVNRYGVIVSSRALDKYGKIIVPTVPDAPTISTATAGIGLASVPFTEPAYNGGSPITSYTATSYPDNITGTLYQAESGTITVTGLTNGTAYTFTVRATNAIGTSAASAASNSVTPQQPCGSPISYGGQSYATVQIGTQCWMAENLNIGTRIDGSANQTNNTTIEKYCYTNNTSNCDVYGGLYQWDEMMQYVTTSGTQGICPHGWHLPSDPEWCILEQLLDPSISCNSNGFCGTSGGGQMKETDTTHWLSPNTGATNTSGFTGRGGGERYHGGSFISGIKQKASFWTSTACSEPYPAGTSYHRSFYWSRADVNRFYKGQAYGFSVRCVRD